MLSSYWLYDFYENWFLKLVFLMSFLNNTEGLIRHKTQSNPTNVNDFQVVDKYLVIATIIQEEFFRY